MSQPVQDEPRISMGMPVYNGEDYIKDALDSLLAQTLTDFELIISDNASTDGTEAICREYAAKDSRIRYYRNVENLGAAENYNIVLRLARAKYFKWVAHDDIWMPEFLEQASRVLDQDPSVALCYSRVKIIDRDGKPMEKTHRLYLSACNLDMGTHYSEAYRRFWGVTLKPHSCFAMFGLVRTEQLRQVVPYGSYGDADRVLLGRMSLLGKFYELPEELLWLRRHESQSLHMSGMRELMAWLDPKQTKKMSRFPALQVSREIVRSVSLVDLPWHEKLLCYGIARLWLLNRIKWEIYDTRLRPSLKYLALKLAELLNLKVRRKPIKFS